MFFLRLSDAKDRVFRYFSHTLPEYVFSSQVMLFLIQVNIFFANFLQFTRRVFHKGHISYPLVLLKNPIWVLEFENLR